MDYGGGEIGWAGGGTFVAGVLPCVAGVGCEGDIDAYSAMDYGGGEIAWAGGGTFVADLFPRAAGVGCDGDALGHFCAVLGCSRLLMQSSQSTGIEW